MRESFSPRALLGALDYPLLLAVAAVYAIGVVTIYSAAGGSGGAGGYYASRQLIWGALSLCVFAVLLATDPDFFLENAYLLYGLCCLSLLLLLAAGLRVKGARSWLDFGVLRVQPAEFAKLGVAFVMARRLTQRPPETVKSFAGALALGGVSALLVMIQPDLGSTLVYAMMIFAALTVAGAPAKYLLSLTGAGLAVLPAGWMLLKEYQKKRILVFINPELDPLGAGYNVIQSRIAVGSGHFWGAGYMRGAQSKLRFLPEPHTDFIFSVYAEEFGLAGCLLLLALFAFIVWRMMRVALRSRSVATKVIVASLAASLWFHSFESIGMSMGLLPVTGLPLPFMSYGGSSLAASVLAVGVVARLGAAEELERVENSVPEKRSAIAVRKG